MKKYMLLLVFAVAALNLQAQNQDVKISEDVKVGDVFEIGAPEITMYKHINFPRPNFIIKQGGILNYRALENNKVIVTALETDKKGETLVHIKRADGKKFFRNYNQVSVDFKDAIASGELRTL